MSSELDRIRDQLGMGDAPRLGTVRMSSPVASTARAGTTTGSVLDGGERVVYWVWLLVLAGVTAFDTLLMPDVAASYPGGTLARLCSLHDVQATATGILFCVELWLVADTSGLRQVSHEQLRRLRLLFGVSVVPCLPAIALITVGLLLVALGVALAFAILALAVYALIDA